MKRADFRTIIKAMGDNSVTIILDIINGDVNMLIAAIASTIDMSEDNYFIITVKTTEKDYTYYIPYEKVLAVIGC